MECTLVGALGLPATMGVGAILGAWRVRGSRETDRLGSGARAPSSTPGLCLGCCGSASRSSGERPAPSRTSCLWRRRQSLLFALVPTASFGSFVQNDPGGPPHGRHVPARRSDPVRRNGTSRVRARARLDPRTRGSSLIYGGGNAAIDGPLGVGVAMDEPGRHIGNRGRPGAPLLCPNGAQ